MKLKSVLTAVLLILTLLCGCSQINEESDAEPDFDNAKIGLQTGTSHTKTVSERYPNAEKIYMNLGSELIVAAEQGKIDYYIEDEPYYIAAIWEGADIICKDEPFSQVHSAFAFPKNPGNVELVEQVNEFIAESHQNNFIEELNDKWLSESEPDEHPDYSTLSGENGTILVATVAENKPMSYPKDGGFTGYEIDLLTAFAREYGYALEFEAVPFESVIMGLAADKYDMAAAGLNITEERKESINFSDSYNTFDVLYITARDKSESGKMSVDDLEKGKIGVLTGSVYAGVLEKRLPNATLVRFGSFADMTVSVQQGKIDAFVEDRTLLISLQWEKFPLMGLDEVLAQTQNAFVLSGSADKTMKQQLNDFILKASENGELERLEEKWFSEKEPTEHPDYTKLSGENGTIKVAVGDSMKPMTYQKGSMSTGYEIDLLTMFAEEYGYKLAFEIYTFDGVIPAVTMGKCDIGSANMSITEERAQVVEFSEPHYTADGIVIVADSAAGEAEDLFEGIKKSFEKTFIKEDRWKLIIEGIGVTMLISICSAIGGSALGFGLYMLERSERKHIRLLAHGVGSVYSRIIAGTPVIVILMVLFYVVFGKIRDLNGILVAILGFSLTFGAFVYGHMTVSINSVDIGQTEAAYALGYTRNRTFFRIVLPQAMSVFMPSYCGEIVSLVKATAVVGYIAVNDLTKVGDIIRSNTYEAFFPLISTAIIYFFLTWGVSIILGRISKLFDPKRRNAADILKGVAAE